MTPKKNYERQKKHVCSSQRDNGEADQDNKGVLMRDADGGRWGASYVYQKTNAENDKWDERYLVIVCH